MVVHIFNPSIQEADTGGRGLWNEARATQGTLTWKKQKKVIKLLLRTFCYTHRSVPCSVIIREADGKNTDTQRQTFLTEWETLECLAQRDVAIKPSPQDSRDREGGDRVQAPEGMEDSRRTGPLYELRETEAACTGPAQVRTRPFTYTLWFPF